jgi:hypothetical protein
MAQQMVALMKLPRQLNKFGDQALGGISDISNRGSLDRLLVSELAQDDLVLTARLANQEALYLRKEAPPEEDKRSKNILLDTTIRVWGTPRALGLAACLASELGKDPNETLQYVALKGRDFLASKLESKSDMAALLGSMGTELHCGLALDAFLNKNIWISFSASTAPAHWSFSN